MSVEMHTILLMLFLICNYLYFPLAQEVRGRSPAWQRGMGGSLVAVMLLVLETPPTANQTATPNTKPTLPWPKRNTSHGNFSSRH